MVPPASPAASAVGCRLGFVGCGAWLGFGFWLCAVEEEEQARCVVVLPSGRRRGWVGLWSRTARGAARESLSIRRRPSGGVARRRGCDGVNRAVVLLLLFWFASGRN